MKKPMLLISNDWHLKPNNIEQILDLVRQKIQLAESLNLDTVYILGDIFDSRIAQRLEVLDAFQTILEMFSINDITVVCIPGNHDKVDYSSKVSFLDPFRHHPNFKLYDSYYYNFVAEDIRIHLMPFFKEDVWIEEIFKPEYLAGDKNILLTHVAFQGSVNNDGTKVSSPIKPLMFNKFDLVLSGHYHNTQQVSPNIFHLPSIQQNNYGEDDNKGFTVVYDDLTFDIVNSQFKRFVKIKVDLDNITKKELNDIVDSQDTVNFNVRFELCGNENKVRSFDKNFLISKGIDVKSKISEIEENNVDFEEEIKQYNIDSLKEEFSVFCSENGLDFETGVKYLKN